MRTTAWIVGLAMLLVATAACTSPPAGQSDPGGPR